MLLISHSIVKHRKNGVVLSLCFVGEGDSTI